MLSVSSLRRDSREQEIEARLFSLARKTVRQFTLGKLGSSSSILVQLSILWAFFVNLEQG